MPCYDFAHIVVEEEGGVCVRDERGVKGGWRRREGEVR